METNGQSNAKDLNSVKQPELILFGTDNAFLNNLKAHSGNLPYISYELGIGLQIAQKARFDAFWATPMMAVELYGATPPFPLHQAQVLRTPEAQKQKGFPRYAIVGVAVHQDDPKDPKYNLRLIIESLLTGVKKFNIENEDQIRRVGILPENLELKKLKPKIAFAIIKEIYERES
jgi:hypothetical protein